MSASLSWVSRLFWSAISWSDSLPLPIDWIWKPNTAPSWIASLIVYLWRIGPYNSSVVRARLPRASLLFSAKIGVPVKPNHRLGLPGSPKKSSNSFFVCGETVLWHSSTTKAILLFLRLFFFFRAVASRESLEYFRMIFCNFWIVVTIATLVLLNSFFSRSLVFSVLSMSISSL